MFRVDLLQAMSEYDCAYEHFRKEYSVVSDYVAYMEAWAEWIASVCWK